MNTAQVFTKWAVKDKDPVCYSDHGTFITELSHQGEKQNKKEHL